MDSYEIAQSLVRFSLWETDETPFPLNEVEDWNAVFKELSDQTISALVSDALVCDKTLPESVRQKSFQTVIHNVRHWNQNMSAQQQLCNLLQEAQIPFVILKGMAAAMYYPKPDCRAMGDVDILVRPEDFLRTAEKLVQQGYIANNKRDDRHIEFSKDGIEIELHRYFACMADVQTAKQFDALLFEGIAQAQWTCLSKYRAPVLPPPENGLVLLVHINQHMETGLGLRQIIDWMLFVDAVLDDSFWSSTFQPWARRIGLETMAITVTRMCQLFLGLRTQNITWCLGADESLCHEVMELTMQRGNFGTKTKASFASIPVLNTMSKLSNIPILLQRNGLKNWNALHKYPFLKPFAWIYQLCRYIRKGLSREKPFHQLMDDVNQLNRQDQIMERLGVTRRLKTTIHQDQ